MTPAVKKILLSILLVIVILTASIIPTGLVPSANAQATMTETICAILNAASQLSPEPTTKRVSEFLAGDKVWYNQSLCQFYRKVFGKQSPPNEMFGERYTYAQLNWIFSSIGAFLLNVLGSLIGEVDDVLLQSLWNTICGGCGEIPDEILKLLSSQSPSPIPTTASLSPNLKEGGVIGYSFTLMDTYSPSFIHQTLPSILEKFNLASPVQAQTGGFGYAALSRGGDQSIQALWTAFRNMSYFLMVLLLVVSGFMIMFRVRMGQTAVTLQLMISRIFLTLVGITFSFPIAGLILDLVYLSLGFFLYLMQQTTRFINVDAGGAGALLSQLSGTGGFFTLWMYFQDAISLITLLLSFIPMGFIIIPVLMIILMFKAWWAMLRAYVHLIIHIITGPFQILLGLLPGQSLGFGQWLRNVTGYAAVFVVIPIVFVFIMIIWEDSPLAIRDLFDPPINGFQQISSFPSLPLFSSGGYLGGIVLQGSIGLIMLSLIPGMVDKIPAAFRATSFGQSDITRELTAAGVMANQARTHVRDWARGAGAPTTTQDAITAGGRMLAGGASWVRNRFGGGGGSGGGNIPPVQRPR